MFEIEGGNVWAIITALVLFLFGLRLGAQKRSLRGSKLQTQEKIATEQENAVKQAKREFEQDKQAIEEKAVEKHEENKTDASAAASAINSAFD